MEKCETHVLFLLPSFAVVGTSYLCVVTDKPADVCNLVCPVCKTTLFLYFRVEPPKEE